MEVIVPQLLCFGNHLPFAGLSTKLEAQMRIGPILIGIAILFIGAATFFWLVPADDASQGKPAPHALDQSAGKGTQ
jgi:hypothetical protein